MQTTEVEILGKKYFFKTDDPQKIKDHADYLNEQLEDLNSKFNTVDQSKLYVLFSMLLTEKYFAEIEKNKDVDKIIAKIETEIDKLGI
jgi:cell division protein ZapA (FtsZ GTPase activity inhibitor)